MKSNKRSGFEPLESYPNKMCQDPSHNPPMHLHIPNNQQYRHVCPSCGYETVLRGSGITFNELT